MLGVLLTNIHTFVVVHCLMWIFKITVFFATLQWTLQFQLLNTEDFGGNGLTEVASLPVYSNIVC